MKQRFIPEIAVQGKRLGRHVNHDDRSLMYLIPEGTPTTVRWSREIPVLDQGNLGSCTGNACVGILGTTPDYLDLPAAHPALDENEAVSLYSAAEIIDGGVGYPPEDDGSSGLSVAKAALNAGLCTGFTHATSVAACHTAIQAGPFMLGCDWYDSFDTPDSNGLVSISSGASVRGGHEIECMGYDAATDLWELVNSWGTSWGVNGHFFMSSGTLNTLLGTDGDATQLTPLNKPAPTPTPPPNPPKPSWIQEIEALFSEIIQKIMQNI